MLQFMGDFSRKKSVKDTRNVGSSKGRENCINGYGQVNNLYPGEHQTLTKSATPVAVVLNFLKMMMMVTKYYLVTGYIKNNFPAVTLHTM